MEPEEFEFLKVCASRLKMSYAQALLHLADFYNRKEEYERPLPEGKVSRIQGMEFSAAPLDEY